MLHQYNPYPSKHPRGKDDCDMCGGFGWNNIGNVCTGFGGKLDWIECWCTIGNRFYKKKRRPESEFDGIGVE